MRESERKREREATHVPLVDLEATIEDEHVLRVERRPLKRHLRHYNLAATSLDLQQARLIARRLRNNKM